MDWKQFIASVVGALAWPTAAIVIVYVFKEQLRHILSQIKKFGAAGVNVELAQEVQLAERASEAVKFERGDVAENAADIDPSLVNLAQNFPEAALLQSFKGLEGTLLRIRQKLPDDKPHRNLNEVLKALADESYISANVITLFQSLRQARNTAAHAKEDAKMTPGEAIQLIGQISLLKNLLENVSDGMPQIGNRI
ncbi:hypothetical protein AB7813_21000 [Tardiphaga sp. 20_F10_N6_6]|jgi:hypothetical protein|uniref:hypothetical protein n=1 Tax=unclassified Tardiphaga TaxID=2631404 RepID=UPI003F1E77D3